MTFESSSVGMAKSVGDIKNKYGDARAADGSVASSVENTDVDFRLMR